MLWLFCFASLCGLFLWLVRGLFSLTVCRGSGGWFGQGFRGFRVKGLVKGLVGGGEGVGGVGSGVW